MEEVDIITKDMFQFVNIDEDKYFVIKLKDGRVSRIYKEKNKDYLVFDNKRYYLDKETQKIMLSQIREYERFGI